GRNDVAYIGIASLTHHTAVHAVTAKVARGACARPVKSGINNIIENKRGPNTRPILCREKIFIRLLFFFMLMLLYVILKYSFLKNKLIQPVYILYKKSYVIRKYNYITFKM